jgi:hypothetical protein
MSGSPSWIPHARTEGRTYDDACAAEAQYRLALTCSHAAFTLCALGPPPATNTRLILWTPGFAQALSRQSDHTDILLRWLLRDAGNPVARSILLASLPTT